MTLWRTEWYVTLLNGVEGSADMDFAINSLFFNIWPWKINEYKYNQKEYQKCQTDVNMKMEM